MKLTLTNAINRLHRLADGKLHAPVNDKLESRLKDHGYISKLSIGFDGEVWVSITKKGRAFHESIEKFEIELGLV